jgi:ADP-heptose:LPS heptosyltransferase
MEYFANLLAQKKCYIPLNTQKFEVNGDYAVALSHRRCPKSIDYSLSTNPVLMFHDGIGDAWISLPAIRLLAHRFPHKLIILCNAYPTPWWLYDLPLKLIVEMESTRATRGFNFNVQATAKAISECDLFICLTYWYNALLHQLLENLNWPTTIGWHPWFNYSRPYTEQRNMAYQIFDLLNIDSTAKFETYAYPPDLPITSQIIATTIIRSITDSSNIILLTVHTDTFEHKMWSKENFTRVFNTLISHYPNVFILIVGMATDIECFHPNIINLTGLSFDESCAIIKQSNCFLGVDSVLLHVADTFRLPCVGLFGPTSSLQFGCIHAPHLHLEGFDSTLNISPNNVVEALEQLYNFNQTT